MGLSLPAVGGKNPGGILSLRLASSSKSLASVDAGPADDCDAEETGRALRIGNDSFRGGIGACSGSGTEGNELSPRGPRGPRGSAESSTDSSFVVCALILRGVRPLPGGEFGTANDDCDWLCLSEENISLDRLGRF